MVTIQQLRNFAPGASTTILSGIVRNQHLLAEAGINTPLRFQHFIAQIAHETGGFKSVEENLRYSAKRLTEVWPKRFPSLASARPYANNPAALAEKVYGGRLGNEEPGDGWDYRGSGLMQTTGKDNFAQVARLTGVDVVKHPDLLRTFPGALEAAAIYWDKRGINKLADRNDVTGVTKAINGGTIGLPDRKAWLAKARKAFPKGLGVASGSSHIEEAPEVPVKEPRKPASTVGTARDVVRKVQAQLTALRYNPGGSDGIVGPLTKGAILAFRNDNKLPLSEEIDDQLILALAEAEPRQMIATRTNATVAQVAGMVPEARAHWWNRLIAGGAAAGTAAGGAVEYIAPATGYLQPIRDTLGEVPNFIWVLAILLVCGVLYYAANYGAKKVTQAYQEGDRR